MSYANRPLNRQDYKTLTLAALGGALEFYDFIIFVFFAAVVGELFFPADIPEWLRQVQTFGIFAAGYLARPLGGIIMAHFGDLVGRKKMFTLSILLMALPTLAIGLLPTYSSVGIIAPLLLLLMRILQGAAIGGEVPGAWVFVAEHVPEKRIGIACGTLTAGLDGWHSAGVGGGHAYQYQSDAAGDPRRRLADPLPAGRRIWSDSDVSAPLAAGDADFS
ncbi:L-Proline/Glycine betaine transporter ProP [Klebsiella pneumoniae subsp. ozaenae]|uniref:L-Proline/Glycine betaine transporter ProP n=1 Tax=Klebsiella pneumoniae subsp. ozaenae TaxID=574 RepID=A0A378C218_KLEPO|nr:L-Proline/Glycine betaine transporter ProP [Klebsiella pneumoniae subsp. ozaenae]